MLPAPFGLHRRDPQRAERAPLAGSGERVYLGYIARIDLTFLEAGISM